MDSKTVVRKRLDTFRWSEKLSRYLLKLIVDAIKDQPDSFEAPTARRFYERVVLGKSGFEEATFLVIKNKMRCNKMAYLKAIEWQHDTGADLSVDYDEAILYTHVEKICPNFNLLHQIYGMRVNGCFSEFIEEDLEHPKYFGKLLTQPTKYADGMLESPKNVPQTKFEWEMLKFEKEMELKARELELREKELDLRHEESIRRLEMEERLKMRELALKYKHINSKADIYLNSDFVQAE